MLKQLHEIAVWLIYYQELHNFRDGATELGFRAMQNAHAHSCAGPALGFKVAKPHVPHPYKYTILSSKCM